VSKHGNLSARDGKVPLPQHAGRARRLVRLLLLFFAAVIVVDALVGDHGVLAMLDARRRHDELAATITRQRAENARLREEARRLREDPSAIEELARRDLGLIRPGEKVFIIKDLTSPEKDLTSPARDLTSRAKDLMSPARALIAPSSDPASPVKDLTSPARDTASPARDLPSTGKP
jgi:cell division protein FtsB